MEKITKLRDLRIGSFVNAIVGGIIYCILSIAGIATSSVGYYMVEAFGKKDLITWIIAFAAVGLLLFILSISEFVDMIRSLNIKSLVFTDKGVKKDVLATKIKKMKANEAFIVFMSLLVIAAIAAVVILTFKSGYYLLALFMIPALFVAVISLILAGAAGSAEKKALASV